jgi:hypothetical protein
MKVVRKGNTYRKAGWLKEHEYDIWFVLCAILGIAIFIVAMLIKG